MLGLARQVPLADRLMREGRWAKGELTAYNLAGKTLGVIGLGSIGTRVAELGAAWGMRVIGCVQRPCYERRRAYEDKGIELLPVLAQMAVWGRRFLPVTEELGIRAQLLEEGGPALWEGKLYFGTYGGAVYAVGAKSGKQVWRTGTSGANFGLTSGNFYATPAVAYGRVFIGNTAERVLDELPCDLLVVKPPRFRSPVARARRGVRLVATPPPMPAFYHHPQTIDDLIDHTVARILDQFAIEVAGVPTTAGSRAVADHASPAGDDARHVSSVAEGIEVSEVLGRSFEREVRTVNDLAWGGQAFDRNHSDSRLNIGFARSWVKRRVGGPFWLSRVRDIPHLYTT